MTHPLIERLTNEFGYPLLDEAALDRFVEQPGEKILLIAGDNKETGDVAVVLPELNSAFSGRFAAAVLAREAEPAAKERFAVRGVPALLFFRGPTCLGAIERMQDWDVYLNKTVALLAERAS